MISSKYERESRWPDEGVDQDQAQIGLTWEDVGTVHVHGLCMRQKGSLFDSRVDKGKNDAIGRDKRVLNFVQFLHYHCGRFNTTLHAFYASAKSPTFPPSPNLRPCW